MTSTAGELARVKPHMGSIINGVQLLLGRLREAAWDPRKASTLAADLIAEAQRKAEQAADHAALLLPQQGTVLTCSYSDTVVQALWAAHRLGRQLTVKVLPSAGYGRLMAEEARRLGVKAEVVNTLPKGATTDDTAGLIGADTVVPGKVVINGAPSLGLAKWCSDRALRLYVVCDSLKLLAQAPVGATALPPGMERVPMRHVAAVVTETGAPVKTLG